MADGECPGCAFFVDAKARYPTDEYPTIGRMLVRTHAQHLADGECLAPSRPVLTPEEHTAAPLTSEERQRRADLLTRVRAANHPVR
ncbi:hypothetical protein ACIRST_29970 [Kitasatospora sp. NPDC101447]|uniref:hypothetical protein n=1 Tax=Kitasatospora sp. NPDC101447 TaxID=3364102 RepID=UPI003828D805